MAAALLTTVSAACGGGHTGQTNPSDHPIHLTTGQGAGEASAISVVKTDLVKGASRVRYTDEKRGITTDVLRFETARNLTEAVDVVRSKEMREAHWDKATKLALSAELTASSPDVIGIMVKSTTEGPKGKTKTASLWYDARHSQTFSSPILIEPAQWKSFADQVHAIAGKARVDTTKADGALVATAAPYGDGPAMAFNQAGDLVLEFASGVIGAEPVVLKVSAAEVGPRLSEFGALAQKASQKPTAYAGTPSKPIPRFTPGPKLPEKVNSPNAPSDGTKAAAVLQPKAGGAVRPSTAVGVDCVINNCVALTYDDGPGNDTPKLLDILDKDRVAATFFQLGKNIDRQPDVVKHVASNGQEIGNHTLTHPDLARQSPERVKEEVKGNSEKLAKILGAKPLIFRPPYGSHNKNVEDAVTAEGMAIIQWSIDSQDWRSKNAAATQTEVLSKAVTMPQPIVLMHDIHSSTVVAAPEIVSGLKQKQMTFVTVSELSINTGGLQPGHAYCSGTALGQHGFACKG